MLYAKAFRYLTYDYLMYNYHYHYTLKQFSIDIAYIID